MQGFFFSELFHKEYFYPMLSVILLYTRTIKAVSSKGAIQKLKWLISLVFLSSLVAIAEYLVNANELELEYLLWSGEILFSTIYRRKF